MTDPTGPDAQQPPAGYTPQQPPAGYTPQQPPAGGFYPPAQPQKSNTKKWLGIAGGVVVAGGVAAYSLTGGFGVNDPKAGDCLDMKSDTDFDVVDCDADEAEARIAGIDDTEMTSKEFDEAPAEDLCTEFETTEYMIWSGDIFTEPGTIYCLESL